MRASRSELLAELRIGRELWREHFDGDDAIEAGVAGAVDLAHAASADGRDNFIGYRDGRRREGHGRRDRNGEVQALLVM